MRLIITGGGTGGHIYPAMSILKRLETAIPDCETLYIGSKYGLENQIIDKKKVPFKKISVRGFERDSFWYSFISIFYLIKSLVECFVIIRKYKPELVIGMGGYVSGPVVLVAYLMRVDIMIHEQNSVPGMTTRFLSKFAKKVLLSYKESMSYFKRQNRLYYTGNPVREEFQKTDRAQSRKELGVQDDEFLILSTGGSNGSMLINEISLKIIELARKNQKIKYIHLYGKYYEDEYKEKKYYKNLPGNVKVKSYTDDIFRILVSSDLMLCRSGAITLAEMAVCQVPGILIPSPNVAGNHQELNAESFQKMGTSIVFHEENLDKEKLIETIENLITNREKLEAMSKSYKKYGKENALNTIISLIYSYSLR